MRLRSGRKRECGVGRFQASIADVAGVVVVKQVVGAGRAAWADGGTQGLQVVHDRGHTGLAQVGAIAVAAAGIAVLIVPVVGTGLRIGIFNLLG